MKVVVLFSVVFCAWSIEALTGRRMEGPDGADDFEGQEMGGDGDGGRRVEEQTPGRRVEEESPGRRVEEESPGRRVEESPGRRVEEESPGRRVEEESPGRRVEEESPGRRILDGNSGGTLGSDIGDVMDWSLSFSVVSCGGGRSVIGDCSGCPEGNGEPWCKGDCIWMAGQCTANESYDYLGEGYCTDNNGSTTNHYRFSGPTIEECLSTCSEIATCYAIGFMESVGYSSNRRGYCTLKIENGAEVSNPPDGFDWKDLGNTNECAKFHASSGNHHYRKRTTPGNIGRRRRRRRRRRDKYRQGRYKFLKGRRMEENTIQTGASTGRRIEDREGAEAGGVGERDSRQGMKLLHKLLRRTTE